MSGTPRVAVIGGGVIGSAIAWRLAREARVVLLERGRPGSERGEASPAAAGMLAPLKEAEEPGPFMELGLRSMERYPAFVESVEAASGVDVGFWRDGRLDVALDDEAAEGLHRHRELQADAGHESRILGPAEVRELEPAIGPEAVLGLATDYDHQLDPARLSRALWLAAERAGVETRTDTPVAGVVTAGGAVRGVRLESGALVEADAVVVAAGAWSGQIELPLRLPVRPVRGQIVVLRTASPVLGRTTWGPHLYLVPRPDGRLVVGSTMEEAGFAPRITAGAVARLLGLAVRVVPVLAEAEVEGFRVGLRPAAEDGLPVIGPDPAVDGLFYATGHFRNGILLAPETAERIAAMVLDGASAEPAFDPGRFAT